MKLGVHLGGCGPVVRGPGFVLSLGADVGALLDTGDVIRMGAMIIAAGKFFLIESDEDAGGNGLVSEPRFLRFRTIAPVNMVWKAQRRHIPHPIGHCLMLSSVTVSSIHKFTTPNHGHARG